MILGDRICCQVVRGVLCDFFCLFARTWLAFLWANWNGLPPFHRAIINGLRSCFLEKDSLAPSNWYEWGFKKHSGTAGTFPTIGIFYFVMNGRVYIKSVTELTLLDEAERKLVSHTFQKLLFISYVQVALLSAGFRRKAIHQWTVCTGSTLEALQIWMNTSFWDSNVQNHRNGACSGSLKVSQLTDEFQSL